MLLAAVVQRHCGSVTKSQAASQGAFSEVVETAVALMMSEHNASERSLFVAVQHMEAGLCSQDLYLC
jgi:hypothetical protein